MSSFQLTASLRLKQLVKQKYPLLKLTKALAQKYKVETSSDLHKYTKRSLISKTQDDEHQYRLIHTPSQTVYATRPHKYQDGYKNRLLRPVSIRI